MNRMGYAITSVDPWEILAGDNAILYLGSTDFWAGLYTFLRMLTLGVFVIAAVGSIFFSIASNALGDSTSLQENKRKIVENLLMIAVVTGLLSGLTWVKSVIDMIFGF